MLTVRILVFYSIYLCLPVILCSPWQRRQRTIYCKTPDSINNAVMSRRSSIMRITCQNGYTLQGPRLIECVHGKWLYDEKPVCSRNCAKNTILPQGTRLEGGYKAVVECHSGYIVAGNRVAYCTGVNADIWDRPLGVCRPQSRDTQYKCDFETDDLCGWSIEFIDNHQWKRKSVVNVLGYFSTGPQHDHTVMTRNDGHFMIMESLREYGVYVPLISPIYQRNLSLMTACCFRFYYFMYGIGIGDLYVYVKPHSVPWETLMEYPKYMKFNISGHQESSWKQVTFNIPEMEEDFQIVFLAKSTKSHLSDIAIDDVSLMFGADCPKRTLSATTKVYENTDDFDYTSTNEPAIADTQTCESRCFDSSKSGLIIQNGKFYLYCDCHLGCEETQSCCLDYRTECLPNFFTDMLEVNNSTTTTAKTPTTPTIKIVETTKPLATTIIKKPLSTTRTIASTTRKAPTSTTLKTTFRPTSTTKTTTPKTTREITRNIVAPSTLNTEIPISSYSTLRSKEMSYKTDQIITFTTTAATITIQPPTTEIISTILKNITSTSKTTPNTTNAINVVKDNSTAKPKVIKWKYKSNENIIEHPNERGVLLFTFIAIIIIILIAAGFRCRRNIQLLLKITDKKNAEEIKDMAKFSNNNTPSIEIYQGTTVVFADNGKKTKRKNKFFKSKPNEMSEPLCDDESPTSDL